MEEGLYDYVFNVVLIGDTEVGKSAMAKRFTQDTFDSQYRRTIFADFYARDLDVFAKKVKLQIRDVSGGVKYRSLIIPLLEKGNAVITLFDLTNKNSFEHVDAWKQLADEASPDGIPNLLVGNKDDLKGEGQVSFEDACAKQEELGMLNYHQITVKDNLGVTEAFQAVAEACLVPILEKEAKRQEVARKRHEARQQRRNDEIQKKKIILSDIKSLIDAKIKFDGFPLNNNPYNMRFWYAKKGKIGFMGKLPTPIISVYEQCRDALDANTPEVTLDSAIENITHMVEKKWLKTGCEDKWWYKILQAIRNLLGLNSKKFVDELVAIDEMLASP